MHMQEWGTSFGLPNSSWGMNGGNKDEFLAAAVNESGQGQGSHHFQELYLPRQHDEPAADEDDSVSRGQQGKGKDKGRTKRKAVSQDVISVKMAGDREETEFGDLGVGKRIKCPARDPCGDEVDLNWTKSKAVVKETRAYARGRGRGRGHGRAKKRPQSRGWQSRPRTLMQ